MYSLNQIHNTMLNHIDDKYQKTEGFATYDLTRGIAYGEYPLWSKAFKIEEKQDVDNLEGEELDRFIFQHRGMTRNKAVKATGYIRVVSGGGTVREGDLFESAGGIQYRALETKECVPGDVVKIEAVEGGRAGNVGSGAVDMMPMTIQGIGSIINDNPISGGYDDETDDDYRNRYYEDCQHPPNGRNKWQFISWAKSVDGVGDAKCIPVWAGINTVKVIIIGNDHLPADDSLVAKVQDYIDPGGTGKGEGQADVGAMVTVISANRFNIDVDVQLTLLKNADRPTVEEDLKIAIDSFIKALAFKSDYVSYSRLGAAILNVDGVLDYSDLHLNSKSANVEIGTEDVAVLNSVVIRYD